MGADAEIGAENGVSDGAQRGTSEAMAGRGS